MTNSANSSEYVTHNPEGAAPQASSEQPIAPIAPIASNAADQEASVPPKARLLLVDDNPDNLRLLSRMLTRKQYATDLASSGREALTIARTSLCQTWTVMRCVNALRSMS
jgi:PleD family two-component response regulator